MKRLIHKNLLEWKTSPHRKPLLLRGARQVGKTHAVRYLANEFENFIEVNLEKAVKAQKVFEGDLDPEEMIKNLSLLTGKPIEPGKTLLFIDEIQAVPRAITALRYFYEEMPELHVIAAGSLVDFAIKKVGVPVGRISFLYVYPMTFIEYLLALNHNILIKEIIKHETNEEISPVIHQKLLELVAEYLAIGGMPEAVLSWRDDRDPNRCFEVHQELIDTYRQDFEKYAKGLDLKYLNVLFSGVPRQIGKKFKYSEIEGGYRKRELAPCLDCLS